MDTAAGLKERIGGKTINNLGKTHHAFNVSPENRRVIFNFDNEMVANGLNPITRTHYLYALARLADRINKPFKDMKREDIARFFVMLKSEKIGHAAVERDRSCIKRFFKWHLGGDEEYPDCVRWLKKNGKDMNHEIQPEELLTQKDIKKLIETAANMRDKAIISILAETGCRRGELASCRIKDVEFCEGYARINFPGAKSEVSKDGVAKTGSYQSNLFDSEPYVRAWLNIHPAKNEPDAALFVGFSRRRYGLPLRGCGIYGVVKEIENRAGLHKRLFPHLFRHSKASMMLMNGYSGQEINLLQGRKKDSKVLNAYLHLDRKAIQRKELIERGLLQEKKESSPLEPQKCWRCSAMNPCDSKFCTQCGGILNPEIKEKIKQQQEASQIATAETMLTPAFAEKVLKELREKPENVDKMIEVFKELRELTSKEQHGK